MNDFIWEKERDAAIAALRKIPSGSNFLLSTEIGMISVIHEVNLLITIRSMIEVLHGGIKVTEIKSPEQGAIKQKFLEELVKASDATLEATKQYESLRTFTLDVNTNGKKDGAEA